MRRNGFLDSTVLGISHALSRAMTSEDTARQAGLLQSLDPRIRIVGLFSLVFAVILSRKISMILALLLLAILIAGFSGVSLSALAKRVWLVVLAFTGIIALPAVFLTPGNVVATLAGGSVQISVQGLRTATLLIARVETAVTLSTLLILCTPWLRVLKALRAFRVPPEVILILAMTHRYIFVLLDTANNMFESRLSRMIGKIAGASQRRMATSAAGVLLSKSMELSNEVYDAMRSRGFTGEVRVLSESGIRTSDYLGLLAFLFAAFIAVWAGR